MTALIRQWPARLRRNGTKPLDLFAIPRPADADDVCVIRNLEGRWAVCWWRQGRFPEPFGPSFASAPEAIAVSRDVREKLGLAT